MKRMTVLIITLLCSTWVSADGLSIKLFTGSANLNLSEIEDPVVDDVSERFANEFPGATFSFSSYSFEDSPDLFGFKASYQVSQWIVNFGYHTYSDLLFNGEQSNISGTQQVTVSGKLESSSYQASLGYEFILNPRFKVIPEGGIYVLDATSTYELNTVVNNVSTSTEKVETDFSSTSYIAGVNTELKISTNAYVGFHYFIMGSGLYSSSLGFSLGLGSF